MDNFLIILCGLPSSGKSRFSNELQSVFHNSEHREFQELSIVDVDKIREREFGSDFRPENESEARKIAKIDAETILKSGKPVIVDDINYYNSMRHEFKAIADALQIPYYIIWIKTPLEICLEWNENRETQINDDIINDIATKFDEPGTKYAWDAPFLSFDLSKISLNEAVKRSYQKINENLHDFQYGSYKEHGELIADHNEERIELITRKILHYIAEKKKDQKYKSADQKLTSIIENNPFLPETVALISNKYSELSVINKIRKKFVARYKTELRDEDIKVIVSKFLDYLI